MQYRVNEDVNRQMFHFQQEAIEAIRRLDMDSAQFCVTQYDLLADDLLIPEPDERRNGHN